MFRHVTTGLLVMLALVSQLPASFATEQLFLDNCSVCHQADGMGIPNVYPALASSEVVRGSAVDMALVLIIGRGEMPSFKGALSNEDMAAIINYVRNSWGNSGELITAERIGSLQ